MARGGHSETVVGSAVVIREKYYWPDLQLNIWTFVMLATAGTILGVNASFMQIQNRMGLGIPWYVIYNLHTPANTTGVVVLRTLPKIDLANTILRIMPYGVVVGSLCLVFILIELVFIAQRQLLPQHMLLLSFILLVLFIAGIAGTAQQLFGGPNINSLCNQFTAGLTDAGPNVDTLAFLQQKSICEYFPARTSSRIWLILEQVNPGKQHFLSGL